MTQHVRKSYRNHRKTTWAGVFVVLVVAALVSVLPALGEDTGPPLTNGVAPPSGQGVFPSIVDVGGSNFSCALAGASGMEEFQISKPTPGTYEDTDTGVKFVVKAPTPPNDSKSFFSFEVQGAAAVFHVGVKGGTKVSWYDYNLYNDPSGKVLPTGGVVSDENLHSTPDSKYTPSKPTFFVASITTFCYVPFTTPTLPLTTTPTCDEPFQGHALSATVLYEAQLVFQSLVCKDGDVVMYSFAPGTNELFATLHPVTPGGTPYQVVEHLRRTGIGGDIQNPITLQYDDIAPFDGVDHAGGTNDGWRLMKLCGSDPRPFPSNPPLAAGESPFDLGGNTPAMPAADGDGPHTTCMLQSTDSAGTGTSGRTYDAWLFSIIDGARGGT